MPMHRGQIGSVFYISFYENGGNNMGKIRLQCFLILLLMLILTGCQFETVYYKPLDQRITSIELVSLESCTNFDILKTLSYEEQEAFLKELKEVPFVQQTPILDPSRPAGNGFKITYKSGEYEIISASAWGHVKDGTVTYSWIFCYKESYLPLWESYMEGTLE